MSTTTMIVLAAAVAGGTFLCRGERFFPLPLAESRGWLKRPFFRLRRRWQQRQRPVAEALRAWARDAALHEREALYTQLPAEATQFIAWLNRLDEADLLSFSQQVTDFCAEIGLPLTWLVDGTLADDPDLQITAENALTLYSLACWQAKEAEAHIAAFTTFRAWQINPMSSHNLPLSGRLFDRLVHHHLAQAPPPSLILQGEKERQAYVAKAIQTAASTDRTTFNEVLVAVLVEQKTAVSASPKRKRRTKPVFALAD